MIYSQGKRRLNAGEEYPNGGRKRRKRRTRSALIVGRR